MEAAGVVLDVGPGVGHLRAGQRVAYAGPPVGAYATVRTMKADLVVPLPDSISDEVAAAILLKGMAAEFLRSEGHTSELQSLMRISYAVFCLKKKITTYKVVTTM